MRNKNFDKSRLKKGLALLFGILFINITFTCTAKKPLQTAGFYSFEFNGEKYRIRSIYSKDKTMSYNELIGKSFVAVDYNKDGIVDEITINGIRLSEAQKIYQYALNKLSRNNKLHHVTSSNNCYQHVNAEYTYEINSFRSDNNDSFNEFKIKNNHQLSSQQSSISIDHNADGTIDEIVHGTIPLVTIQAKYSDVIQKGLKENKLIEINDMILTREK